MIPKFTQDIQIFRLGFGNSCKAVIGTPTPDPDSLITGSKLVRFDRHPYIAKDGCGNQGEIYDEQPVQSCHGVMVHHYDGLTETIVDMDFDTSRAFWGLPGYNSLPGLWHDNRVRVGDDMTEVFFEIDYDTSILIIWYLDRVCFQYVEVELNGEVTRFENVGCTPSSAYGVRTMFRMWGQTDSWGSEGERILVIPFSFDRDALQSQRD